MTTDAERGLRAGQDALQRGAWEEARTSLEQSIAAAETPEALECLGLAAWWLDDAGVTFDAREQAYRLYRESGDARGAARVALWLVWDNLAFRGDPAVASGWLERARRILQGHESTPEYGWLLVREGEVALFRAHDPAAARALALQAAELGRASGDLGLELTGLALEGLAMVSAGSIADGMRRLDEANAAATAGEIKELHTVGVVGCWQIFACERVRDYDRAAQWCARMQEFSKRWRVRALSAICRTQYAGVLIWRGAWTEAEAELAVAQREFDSYRPGNIGQALARLGDLRLRQGKLDEAASLFERGGSQPLARLGLAVLALERGDPAEGAALLDRFLGNVTPGEPTVRAWALELAVRAYTARGDLASAGRLLAELEQIAQVLGTAPLSASAAAARGVLSRGREDYGEAAASFEKSADLYEESSAPYEAASSRLELAEALGRLGRRDAAEREARSAQQTFTRLGAERAATRTTELLRELGQSTRRGADKPDLTTRQLEILRLVAKGLSNPDIAAQLKLSDHTVKRHVANLLTRLRLSSRAAAAAYAAQNGILD